MSDPGLFATLMAIATEAGEKGEMCFEVIEALAAAVASVYQWASDMFPLTTEDTPYQKTKRVIVQNATGMDLSSDEMKENHDRWFLWRGLFEHQMTHARSQRTTRLRQGYKLLKGAAQRAAIKSETEFGAFCKVYPPAVCEEPGSEECSCPQGDELISAFKKCLLEQMGTVLDLEEDSALAFMKELMVDIDPDHPDKTKRHRVDLWNHMSRDEMLTGPWGIRLWGLHLPTFKSECAWLNTKQKLNGVKSKVKDCAFTGPTISALVDTAKSLYQLSVKFGQVENICCAQQEPVNDCSDVE